MWFILFVCLCFLVYYCNHSCFPHYYALQLADQRVGFDSDESRTWLRWMKATPVPMFIDLSNEFRKAANETLGSLEVMLSFFLAPKKAYWHRTFHLPTDPFFLLLS
jgi:hypothetical protein